MTPHQHSVVYVMSTDPNARFPRFKDHLYQSDKKNFDKAVNGGLSEYLNDITDEDSCIEAETLDSITDRAKEADDYDDIARIVKDGFNELENAVKECQKPGHFVFLYDGLIGPVPDKYKDEIVAFCDDVKISYEINPVVDWKDFEYMIDEIQEAWKDAAEYAKDPYAYYGVSRSDFM